MNDPTKKRMALKKWDGRVLGMKQKQKRKGIDGTKK